MFQVFVFQIVVCPSLTHQPCWSMVSAVLTYSQNGSSTTGYVRWFFYKRQSCRKINEVVSWSARHVYRHGETLIGS